MPAHAWLALREPTPDLEYLAILSELPLKKYGYLGEFLPYSRQVREQLRGAPGLPGYSVQAAIFRKRFWTLSVWQNEAALQRFVKQPPHGRIMQVLQGKMGPTRFVRWTLQGSEYPPSWREAFDRASTGPVQGETRSD